MVSRTARFYRTHPKARARHTKHGIVYKKSSVNRGSKSDMAGDRRARGKKRK